jgi:hypothetical protein
LDFLKSTKQRSGSSCGEQRSGARAVDSEGLAAADAGITLRGPELTLTILPDDARSDTEPSLTKRDAIGNRNRLARSMSGGTKGN